MGGGSASPHRVPMALGGGGDSGDPQPSPSNHRNPGPPASYHGGGRGEGRGHGGCVGTVARAGTPGPRRVPQGHAEGGQQPPGVMGSASRPRHRVEGDGEHGEAVASISGCTASASGMWPWQASRGCGRSHGDDFSTTETASGPR